MIKVVIDTNVLISFLLTKSPTISKIIDLWDGNLIKVCYSRQTFDELKAALEYPKLRKYIKDKDKQFLLDKLVMAGKFCKKVQSGKRRPKLKDTRDKIFIDLAKASDSHYLITGDRDLLALGKIESAKIVTPSKFISILG